MIRITQPTLHAAKVILKRRHESVASDRYTQFPLPPRSWTEIPS